MMMMMVEGQGSSCRSNTVAGDDRGFISTLFSWSLEDIYNDRLFKVEEIPESFESVPQYFRSFMLPLLEETRAELHSAMEVISSKPFAEVTSFSDSKPHEELMYNAKVNYWRNRFSERGKEPYRTLPGDILVLADAKPETVSDLERTGRSWTLALVTNITDDDNDAVVTTTLFKVKAAKEVEVSDGMHQRSLFVIYLINISTSRRIWNALHLFRNLDVIRNVLRSKCAEYLSCQLCSSEGHPMENELLERDLSSQLNESQIEAILACVRKLQCNHKSTIELIWGPPGAGKTKTVSLLLFTLLEKKYRILTCAPTNVAITEVASRVLKLVVDSSKIGSPNQLFYPLGNIVLYGNKDRLKVVNSEFEEIHLEYRVGRLIECFAPQTGWWHCFSWMIDFFEECSSQYYIFVENELIKEKEKEKEDGVGNEKKKHSAGETSETNVCSKEDKPAEVESFLEFARRRFRSTSLPLKRCVLLLCTHVSLSYLQEDNILNIVTLLGLLESFEALLFRDELISEELLEIFPHTELLGHSSQCFSNSLLQELSLRRSRCLFVLRTLHSSLVELNLPSVLDMRAMEKFCLQTASLIFCTASSSYKLFAMEMDPLDLLVIDEAAQLRECESAIPLQLRGVRHAVLIGDECQLPAMVQSHASAEAGFGRSLFERLSLFGHPKHLLNIQYRMHPSISRFPNWKFYFNRISDASHVKRKNYEKHYLPGPMFGPYSFINVFGGREELDDVGHSRKNMVEVAIVFTLLKSLYKAWNISKEKLRIGVISPYAAQVVAIQDKLGKKYDNTDGFSVKVRSVDGFQGGEEDIIIISTVRSENSGAIGFLSDPRRVNVALTRARHALWILGNERTLVTSESVWKVLVHDAKERLCFFNADDDMELARAILDVKKEFDQLDDLLDGNCPLFRSAKWKVLFSEYFRKSFAKLVSLRIKLSILNLLLRLSNGWRPKRRNIYMGCESSRIMKFKVEQLYVICSIDIVKEKKYIQVLKIWDVLPLEDIPKLVKRLECIFERHTDDFISRCKERCLEGDIEVPKTWSTAFDIVRYKSLSGNEPGSTSSDSASDGSRYYVENSKVSDSLLLMKFYSLSAGVVKHLLSDRDGKELDLPFEVTDEELEIILFQRSTFILGRSGTGKTTVLTMKLFKKEQLFYMAAEGLNDEGDDTSRTSCKIKDIGDDMRNAEDGLGETTRPVLRQLFVTVSPKLCYAVKHHVSQLKSFASGGKYSADGSSFDMEDIDGSAQFKDIPNSFTDIIPESFPLVITFYKFLMMLDGTVGNSYFERFPEVRQFTEGKAENLGSIAVQTFIRTREVNYDKFCSEYWVRFNDIFTKELDSSRVFTEIMSYIKGGLRGGKYCEGKLSREDYVLLSEGRASTLNEKTREMIFNIFEHYENMKMRNGHFDMADFVIDLHRRLRSEKYEGQIMDYVYIDEVQDLTMKQIALFKCICKNVSEGFVFAGDTAQTIARGIDFRFEDIRSLFYSEFVLGSSGEINDGKKEKGQISKIFHLSHNFRTHAGVLKLAQSVIDLLYRFFPSFIDILSHETSLIFGEAPILLESRNDENAIVTIFGSSRNLGGSFVGFGAEQVVLVRDDATRKEINECVGKHALVLTIVECKGLEFQDVLLYNFFSSSPLRNKWRVVYEYMKEQDLVDLTSPKFTSFNPVKHNVLCSELKQLYVAITRTRQRLWICENAGEFGKPMFDYWTKKALVQVRRLDDSLAQAMLVASTPEEWKSRGYKLLREGNYEMATMCFEKAGDEHGEKLAKAAGLRAAADRMQGLNAKDASIARRQAAEIFESIGKAEYAAECFYVLKEYERAAKIYSRCGESAVEKAAECFYLAGCYKLAAEMYAKANHFSKCLSSCSEGKLFSIGLEYIQYWKQHASVDNQVVKRGQEMKKIEHGFLESCALHFHDLGDEKAMMKYVKAFESMDLIRTFLNNLGCIDELLEMEEELGNFMEAAKLANLKGELLLEADLLGKAGQFKDAVVLILWYVFANSLWSRGGQGWPLKQFAGKQELLTKAQSLAKKSSQKLYEFSRLEAEILSGDCKSLPIMVQQLLISERSENIRGEILCSRQILDVHFRESTSKYVWENNMLDNAVKLSETVMLRSQISLETLVYIWDFWKDKVINIFEYLLQLEKQDSLEYRSYGEFCLNYLGVRVEYSRLNAVYLLMNPDAEWARGLKSRLMHKRGKFISIDVHQFVSAAQSYWSSELLSVGMAVLQTLEALYNFSTNKRLSLFCQGKSLAVVYQVAKFLLHSKFVQRQHQHKKALEKFVGLSTKNFFRCIFPLNLRDSLEANIISLRRTKSCRDLLNEVIFEIVSSNSKLSYGQLGRVGVILLGSGKLYCELYEHIIDSLKWKQSWRALFENLFTYVELDSNIKADSPTSLAFRLHGALVETYGANWFNERDYISPSCFLYLMERLLILLSYSQGRFLCTKSSFIEWLIYQEGNGSPTFSLVGRRPQSIGGMLNFVLETVKLFLIDKRSTEEWIRRSKNDGKEHHAGVVLRLVVIVCLLYLNFQCGGETLFSLLREGFITQLLPWEFHNVLQRGLKHNSLNVNVTLTAEALKKIGNPLMIVSLEGNCSRLKCADAIFVDMSIDQSKEEILQSLFPKKNATAQDQSRYAMADMPVSEKGIVTRPVKVDLASSCEGIVSSGEQNTLESIKASSLNEGSVTNQILKQREEDPEEKEPELEEEKEPELEEEEETTEVEESCDPVNKMRNSSQSDAKNKGKGNGRSKKNKKGGRRGRKK